MAFVVTFRVDSFIHVPHIQYISIRFKRFYLHSKKTNLTRSYSQKILKEYEFFVGVSSITEPDKRVSEVTSHTRIDVRLISLSFYFTLKSTTWILLIFVMDYRAF